MESWIADNFSKNSDENYIIYQSNEMSIGINNVQINVIFFGITTPPKYDDLMALPSASQGWGQIFDDWKAKGIIS